MTIYFVLTNPAVPENIGFACRAIKTMGFGHLRLVNPTDHLGTQAKKTAYGSHDVLERAEVFQSLPEALRGIDLSVATTSRKRLARHDYYSPEEISGMLVEKRAVVNHVAIVFGSERDGLSKEEIGLCDLISTIPLAAPYPSLNLAQSVLLYTWELSKAVHGMTLPIQGVSQNEETEQGALKEKALLILEKLDVTRQPSLYHRIKDRLMAANADDTKLMLSFARFLTQRLKLMDKK